MDLPFEQLLVLIIAAVALLARFLRRAPAPREDDTVSSQPTPEPYFPEDEERVWPPPSRPVELPRPAPRPMRTRPAPPPPELPRRPAPAPAPPVLASARPRVKSGFVPRRPPWLAPVARDRSALRRAIVLMTVFGPPRALAPYAVQGSGEGGR
jgi:hypothetical protein